MAWPSRGTPEDVKLREKFRLGEIAEDGAFVAAKLGKLMLFNKTQPGTVRVPGLSKEETTFFQLHGKDTTWDTTDDSGLNLAETKFIAGRFLASGAFLDSERYIPALCMSVQPDSRISTTGEDLLKRAAGSVSFEETALLTKLYALYLGSESTDGALSAPVSLQTKILSVLCRSSEASSFLHESIQIIRQALAPRDNLQADVLTPTRREGLELSRLRQQVFSFTNWLARISPASSISRFAPDLVGHLQNYIEEQGWPRPRMESPLSQGELSSRAYGYESIGLLASASPREVLMEPNIHLLRWLFTSLSQDPSANNISLSIEQALSSVLGAFGGKLDADLEVSLNSLFLHYMSLSPMDPEESNGVVRSTRFMAVRFANRCLPYHYVQARWIDVLAIRAGTEEGRSEIIEEGKKGLDPYWYRLLNPSKTKSTDDSLESKYQFPEYDRLVECFFGSAAGWKPDLLRRLDFTESYAYGLTYCRSILIHQVLEQIQKAPVIDENWQQQIDALILSDDSLRSELQFKFRSQAENDNKKSQALRRLIHASFSGLIHLKGEGASRAGDILIQLVSLTPDGLYSDLLNRVELLEHGISSTENATQERSAHVFGLIGSLDSKSGSRPRQLLTKLNDKIKKWPEAIGRDAVEVNGAILATSYLFSRIQWRGNRPDDFLELQSGFMADVFNILNESRDKMWIDSALTSVSQMALSGALLPDNILAPHTATSIILKMVEKCRDGNEKAITALGHFAIQCSEEDAEDSVLAKIIAHLYELHTIRQAEIQFAVGAALACAASGWQSKSLVSASDIAGSKPPSAPKEQTLLLVLDNVLKDCRTTKPALRQASVIWLLCLVQYCGHLPEMQTKLEDCQSAFKKFLADRESINQESAARGLALVYEKGNRSLKDDLIKDLVKSFTGGTSGLAGTVSAETELFEAGALPTGDGSITTYKDIMSLAAEVGDSSLVYRFMSLASNNAIWSSRAAFGRFGLSSILNEASTDGYLAQNPKLYPALYRYRFDPNTNVRTAMNDIWNALVKEPSAIIAKHFDAIATDLLKTVLSKEWRARQASCAAIADLIQGRKFEMYEAYLDEIWTCTFKVCDDIKETVRTAAMALARVLTGILTRELETDHAESKNLYKMLNKILPFLLSPSGIESSAPDVRDFARKALLEIIRKGSSRSLRPFVPDLVGRLLSLLSSVEPEMINYIHLNADKYGITADQLDDARLQIIKGSALLESIERCLDLLEESSMPELKQRLENAIRTVIGLPSKVGCSRVLVSLSTRQNLMFKPYADHFLTIARKQVFDRNDTISSSYAVACGYIARLASDKALLSLLESCQSTYFDSDEDHQRAISGEIVYAVSKHATDRFNSIAIEVLPFVFVAKHDIYDRAKSLFSDCWTENVGGSRAVLLYLKEILQSASRNLDSTRWSIKHTSAYAIADAVTSCGTSINDDTAAALWPVLERAISGKTWNGKEEILKAFVHLSKHSGLLQNNVKIAEQMEKVIIREARRNNPAYRKEAFESLGQFAELREKVDMYERVFDVVAPVIEELSGDWGDAMDVDPGVDGTPSKDITETTTVNAVVSTLKAINPLLISGDALNVALSKSMDLWQSAERAGAAGRSLRSGVYRELKMLFERLNAADERAFSQPVKETLRRYAGEIFAAADEVEQIRMEAAEAAIALSRVARVKGQGLEEQLQSGLSRLRTQERSASVQRCLDRAIQTLEGKL